MNNLLLGVALLTLGWLAVNHYRVALAAVVASIPLYLVRGSIFGIPTNLFEVSVLLVMAVAIVQPWWRTAAWAAAQRLPPAVWWLIGGWMVAVVLSILISPELVVSLGILKSWIVVPLVLAGLVAVAGPGTQYLITRGLILSGVVTALASLAEYSPGARLAGMYDVPNSLALWLVPIIVLALWRGGRAGVVAAIPMMIALLATQSVSGLLSLAAALLIGAALFLANRQRARVLLATVLLLGVIATWLVGSGRMDYLLLPWTDGQPNSLSVRGQLWQVSLDVIAEHPLLGVGLGQFEGAYQAKLHEYFAIAAQNNGRAPLPEFVFRDPHNWILSMWLNTGLLGLLAFAAMHLYLFWNSYRLPITDYQLQAPLLALVSLLIFGLADTIYWKNDLAALQWVLLVLLIITMFKGQIPDLEYPKQIEG